MRVTRLGLKNWRNFRSAEARLSARTFIAGANASGKSNLLDALRFLRDIAVPDGGLSRAVRVRGGMKAIRSLHARSDNRVAIDVDVAIDERTWRYELDLTVSRRGEPLVLSERVHEADRQLFHRDASGEDDDERGQTWLQQAAHNKSFRVITTALASIEYTNVIPQVVREQRRPAERAARDPYGSELIEEIARTPTRDRERRIKLVNGALAAILPNLENLRLEHDEATGTPHLRARYRHWRGQAAIQDESSFSDGTLRAIALVWQLSAKHAGPLLLEEQEISLHEAAVAQLPVLIWRATDRGRRQVIVTTHSERMLDDRGIRPSEILKLEATQQDTLVRRGDQDEIVIALAQNGEPLGRYLVEGVAAERSTQLSLALESGRSRARARSRGGPPRRGRGHAVGPGRGLRDRFRHRRGRQRRARPPAACVPAEHDGDAVADLARPRPGGVRARAARRPGRASGRRVPAALPGA